MSTTHAGPRLLLIVLCAASSPCCAPNPDAATRQRVSIVGHEFNLELALDGEMRQQGLSDRQQIDEDGGMLFVFPEPMRASFVMRRCHVPIDLIYLDASGYVVSTWRMKVEPDPMAPDAELTHYSSGTDAIQFAIELRGGWLDALKLKVADRIDLPRQNLTSRAR